MQAGTTASRERRVRGAEAQSAVRQALGEADVRRVTVHDTHGHTIVEVPVRPDEVGVVMEPVLAATRAVADTVGEVVLRVEKGAELPAEGASTAGRRERERAEGRRQAGGGELEGAATAEDVQGARAAAGVTQRDVERIREANAVPEGSEEAVRRIPPEHKGEPDLKGTGD